MSERQLPMAPDGPWPVGLQILELSANSRRIQAYAWYPAAESGDDARAYMSCSEAQAQILAAKALAATEPNVALLTKLRTRSRLHAPVAAGPIPLVIFNHGGGLSPLANFSLMEALASHGMAAVSMGHAGESAALAWQDGSYSLIDSAVLTRMQLPPDALAAFARFVLEEDEPARRRALAEFRALDPGGLRALSRAWADDSLAVVDHLLDPQASTASPDLRRALDAARLAYGGMSLGGSAAFDSCRRDPRATAGFNLDGVNWDFSAIDTDIGMPFLALQADPEKQRSQLAAFAPELAARARRVGNANDFHYEAPERRSTSANVVQLNVVDADHMDFTELTMLARLSAGEPIEEAQDKHRIVVRITRLFLQWAFGMGSRAALDAAIAETPLLAPIELKR